MTNTQLFKSYLVLRDITIQELSELVDIPVSTLSNKINNKNDFKAPEIDAIAEKLGLTQDQIMKVFFAKECTN